MPGLFQSSLRENMLGRRAGAGSAAPLAVGIGDFVPVVDDGAAGGGAVAVAGAAGGRLAHRVAGAGAATAAVNVVATW